jgi:hypothetical protein
VSPVARSFGADLVGQTYETDLTSADPAAARQARERARMPG